MSINIKQIILIVVSVFVGIIVLAFLFDAFTGKDETTSEKKKNTEGFQEEKYDDRLRVLENVSELHIKDKNTKKKLINYLLNKETMQNLQDKTDKEVENFIQNKFQELKKNGKIKKKDITQVDLVSKDDRMKKNIEDDLRNIKRKKEHFEEDDEDEMEEFEENEDEDEEEEKEKEPLDKVVKQKDVEKFYNKMTNRVEEIKKHMSDIEKEIKKMESIKKEKLPTVKMEKPKVESFVDGFENITTFHPWN